MTRILETLLGLARGGRGDSTVSAVDLATLAARRREAWRDVAAQRGVGLRSTGVSSVMSVTDRTIVESALDAVIDNAVKFSPEGAHIEIGARREGSVCRITVRDHGPGLTDEQAAAATDRFWRNADTGDTPGSGLGLAIASDLLETIGESWRSLRHGVADSRSRSSCTTGPRHEVGRQGTSRGRTRVRAADRVDRVRPSLRRVERRRVRDRQRGLDRCVLRLRQPPGGRTVGPARPPDGRAGDRGIGRQPAAGEFGRGPARIRAGDAAADAVSGTGAFERPLEVEALARLYDEYVQVVVRGIRTSTTSAILPAAPSPSAPRTPAST